MKKFMGVIVRQNGFGFDKQNPVSKEWSVLFTSSLTLEQNAELVALFKG